MDWGSFWKWVVDSGALANTVGTVAGGLILSLIVAPKWRRTATALVSRAWAFITSIRITTTKRIEAGKRKAYDDGLNSFAREIAATAKSSSTTLGDLLETTKSTADRPKPPEAVKRSQPISRQDSINALSAGIKTLADATQPLLATPKVDASEALAAWDLSWSHYPSPLQGKNARRYTLTNKANGVAAKRVRVEADVSRIHFHGTPYWDDPTPGHQLYFTATPTGVGDGPIIFTIRWTEHDHQFSKEIRATSILGH